MVLDISTEFGATPNIVHLLYFLPQRHFFKNPFWIVMLGYFFMRLPCLKTLTDLKKYDIILNCIILSKNHATIF